VSIEQLFKIGKLVVVALGPTLTTQVPMAPDLRVYAAWLSGVTGIIGLVVAGAARSRADRERLWRALYIGIAVAILSAVAYVVVNLIWMHDFVDLRDVAFMVALVVAYSITWGALSFISAVGEKLAQKEDPAPGPAPRLPGI